MRVQPRYALQRRRFEIIKEQVSVVTLAKNLIEEASGRLRMSGGELRGYCPVCGNGNHSEAFSASLEKNLWHCHACGEGGDVIDLANLAGRFDSPVLAVAWLGHRYGVELPERPESWYRKQSRQERIRKQLEGEREEIRRRRLFKYLVLPEINLLPEKDRERETRVAWERMKRLPVV